MALKAALAEEKPKAFVSKIKKMLSQGKKDHDNVTSFLSGGVRGGAVLTAWHQVQPSRVRTLDLGKLAEIFVPRTSALSNYSLTLSNYQD